MAQTQGIGFADTDRLDRVELREEPPRARAHAAQQDLDVALYDLGERNRFRLRDGAAPAGPYVLAIGRAERGVALALTTLDGRPAATHHLALAPLRAALADYSEICESYRHAVGQLSRERIEQIDAARRAVHDEGSAVLAARLEPLAATDDETCRRLFTVLAALQAGG